MSEISPSPENDEVYRRIDPDDPVIVAMAESMLLPEGVLEPLVVSLDGFIASGHRRYVAALRAGLEVVPCRVLPVRRSDDLDAWRRLLVSYNKDQREKTNDERLREEIAVVDPALAYQALIDHRERKSKIITPAMRIVGTKRRAEITAVKQPFVDAILQVLEHLKEYLPISDRKLHYELLNLPKFLIHASKRRSVYRNNKPSYKSLTELVTRLRVSGIVPMDWICDETRPVSVWQVHQNPRQFVKQEIGGLFKGYYRDFQLTQPNHIEIVGEKNTVAATLRPIAARYRIPMTTGRGYCSLPPRHAMAERFKKSGKEKLILLLVSDHDPDGAEISQSFARSMRDDFGIDAVHPIKVALTPEQVERFDLPPNLEAKKKSRQYKKFLAKYGPNAYELEAMDAADLQQILQEAIDGVLDVAAFNAEVDAEKADAAWLAGVRKRAIESLGTLGSEVDDE